jgi:PGDYG protein
MNIDRKAPAILAALAVAPIYKKQGRVHARPAVAGEHITTTLATGVKETDNTASEGDYIVTNPSGEQYIISGQKFAARYEAGAEAGVYAAKGFCRAIVNPFGEQITILASWGSPQVGDADCLIADVCAADGTGEGEPYLIDAASFAATYKLVAR